VNFERCLNGAGALRAAAGIPSTAIARRRRPTTFKDSAPLPTPFAVQQSRYLRLCAIIYDAVFRCGSAVQLAAQQVIPTPQRNPHRLALDRATTH
jgi:hypothetical protein